MISKNEFIQRRKSLMQQLPHDAVAVIPGACEQQRNSDVHYPFRQNSHFLYLTGFSEPQAILVLTGGQSLLFCQPTSILTETWTGPLLGPQNALAQLGVDLAFSRESFLDELKQILAGKTAIYYPFLQSGDWEKSLFQAWKAARSKNREDNGLNSSFVDLTPILAELRLFKSEAEIVCMQSAIDCSVNAHLSVMKKVRSCQYEYELLAIFQHELIRQACTETAYPSIIASGHNTCILHYTQYTRRWQNSDLLLIDAGGEWQGYAADITRTYPVSGQWSKEQQSIYELVLHAQIQAIAAIRPGVVWSHMQQITTQILTQGLVDLGILKGSVSGLIEQQAYKAFYMHNSGHWLGLDVHDVGSYHINRSYRQLIPGMVLTVEPGLYFSARNTNIDPRWHGIGVRIEDDILVTSKGAKVLSQDLPKTITDIQDVMSHDC